MRNRAGDLIFKVVDTCVGETTLLFLHYWGGSARTWRVATAQLRSSCGANRYTVFEA